MSWQRDGSFATPYEACAGGATVARLQRLLSDLDSRMQVQEHKGLDINAPDVETGERLLIAAAVNGHGHLVRALVAMGARVNQVDNTVMRQTALHYAAAAGKEDAVVQLLACGAFPHLQDASGDTPLHWCVASVFVFCFVLSCVCVCVCVCVCMCWLCWLLLRCCISSAYAGLVWHLWLVACGLWLVACGLSCAVLVFVYFGSP